MSTEPTKTESETTRDPILAGTKSVSLYVGDLSESVSDDQLFDIFSKSGVVASTRICRDSTTGRSLGYGYVNYHNSDDAEKALKHQNFSRLNGREIRLMWSEPDATKRRLGKGNIVVKNLDVSIDNKTLFDTFSVFGPILSSRVAVDENGETKCYGFVQYENVEDAAKAMSQVNGKVIAGQLVKVVEFKSRQERSPAPLRFTNVFVKNYTSKTFPTEESFNKFFGDYGKITCSHFPTVNGEPKGFGFVNFESPEVAEKVVRELNGYKTGEDEKADRLYVSRAISKAQRRRDLDRTMEEWRREIDSKTAGRNVFVKNLPESLTDEQLMQQMVHHGPIEKHKVASDSAGRTRCFGFVLYKRKEDATAAIKASNGQNWGGKIIYVTLWQRKSERQKAQRMMQNAARPSYGQGVVMPNVMGYGPSPYMYSYGPQMHQNVAMGPQAMGQRVHMQQNVRNAQEAITSESLSQILFERITQVDPGNAAKITGMFADMPKSEMIRMMENPDLFREQVSRAYEVLMGAQEQRQE